MFKKNEEINFFDLFIQSGQFAIDASDKLLKLVEDYSDVSKKVEEIKEIEHKADNHAHTIYKELHKAFITPIEREDILLLNQSLDNVIDDIEHASKAFYMFDVKTLEKDIFEYAKLISKICNVLKEALVEFKNFKKSKDLKEKVIEINNIEEEGDRLYTESVRRLFSSGKDAVHIAKWHDIYKELEKCLDDCEEVSNTIEDVILKNS